LKPVLCTACGRPCGFLAVEGPYEGRRVREILREADGSEVPKGPGRTCVSCGRRFNIRHDDGTIVALALPEPTIRYLGGDVWMVGP
jgi:hypothetical protein